MAVCSNGQNWSANHPKHKLTANRQQTSRHHRRWPFPLRFNNKYIPMKIEQLSNSHCNFCMFTWIVVEVRWIFSYYFIQLTMQRSRMVVGWQGGTNLRIRPVGMKSHTDHAQDWAAQTMTHRLEQAWPKAEPTRPKAEATSERNRSDEFM
jgi:hypothetical protein